MEINKGNVNLSENNKGNLSLEDRKKLSLTGVLEVLSFDDDAISLNTSLGGLNITGKNLKLNKLDVQNGDVIISGYVNSMSYHTKENKKRKLHFINKILRRK